MEILKILEENGKDLYLQDLDFFETELDTGEGYDENYQIECKEKIKKLREWLKTGNDDQDQVDCGYVTDCGGIEVGIGSIAPKEANPVINNLTNEQIIFDDIKAMRESSSYKKNFKDYVVKKKEIDAVFIDKNYSFFKSWELDAIIMVKQMGDSFLEKYFDVLDHNKIARYQEFSESFFIKHYADLDVDIVLEHGKNVWRRKENRSKQLDVFLRLKGVKI